MKNMMNIMKQAREMQKNIENVQKELADRTVVGTTSGGLVEVTLTCNNEIKKVSIKPDAVDPADIETLEDMVLLATKDALMQAKKHAEAEMQRATGGMSLPGLA